MTPPALIDIGVNLAHRSFQADRAAVVARAAAAGVPVLVATGTGLAASRAAAALVRPGTIHATAGVHPHQARELTSATLRDLEALARLPGVVAVGECGLDFNRNFSPPADQERALEMQLELAAALRLPVFLHERDAGDRFAEILGRHRARIPRGVVHCFTGSERDLRRYLDMDLHVGITGWICDERRGRHLAGLLRQIPPDRLMLETDAPFLLPRTMPGAKGHGRNEPAYLPWVLQAVAAALGRSAPEVAAATTRTAREFFGLGR